MDLQGGSVSWGSVQEDSLRCRLKVGLCRDMFSIIVMAIVSPVHAGVQSHQDVDITCVQSFVYRLYLNKAKKKQPIPQKQRKPASPSIPRDPSVLLLVLYPEEIPSQLRGEQVQ